MSLFTLTRPRPSTGAPALDQALPATTARQLILSGEAPDGLRVEGHLDLSNSRALAALPRGLTAASLDLSGCTALRALPAGLQVRRLMLNGCMALQELPAGLSVYELQLRYTGIRALPTDLRVEYRLDLEGCAALCALPVGLTVGSLVLRNCTALTALPEGLAVYFLDLTGCTGLHGWPRAASLCAGRLTMSGCTGLRSLPPWLASVAQLDVSECTALTALPEGVRVASWIELANSGICALPPSLRGVRLRWRGVPIDERIAFRPETITVREVLAEPNAEVRRVLLERMGYEVFLSQAQAEVLDRDQDAGGERRLLCVPLPEDEPLVCLAVLCPSTGRRYVLRVPPAMRSCRQAAAWIAGYDDPDEYHPLAET